MMTMSSKQVLPLLLLAFFLLVLYAWPGTSGAWAQTPSGQPAAAKPQAGVAAERAATLSLEKEWGIRPVSVRPVAAGLMIYFRYQVVDASRAKRLFDRKIKPVLVDHASKEALSMPTDTKIGALRSSPKTEPVNGKQYFVLFSNPSLRVKKGSTVDVVMGDCRISGLTVE